jgi:hypothetical protein
MSAGNQAAKTLKVYQIKLQGRLDASWSDWFGGMALALENGDDASPITTLTGAVVDQAALHGLLTRISDLNLVLISVTQVECSQNDPLLRARCKVKNRVRWLRISYWAGAIGDFVFAILGLIPKVMGVPSYVYPMGLFSAVAFSWGCMLIWADRKPLERRWVLLPTTLVGSMLLAAVLYSISAGAITVSSKFQVLILLPALIALWSITYYRARELG